MIELPAPAEDGTLPGATGNGAAHTQVDPRGGVLTWSDWVAAAAVGLLFGNVGVIAARLGGPSAAAALPYVLLVLTATYLTVVRQRPVIWGLPTTLMLVFTVTGLVSAIAARKPADSVPTVAQWLLEGLVFFVALTNSVRTPEALRLCVQAVVGAGAMVGFFVAYQHLRGNFYNTYFGFAQVSAPYDITSSGSSPLADSSPEGSFRAAGMLGETNFFAMVMTALIPWAVYLVGTTRSKPWRLGWAGAGGFIGYAVLMSYSRGALVALAGVSVVLALCGVLPRRALGYLAAAGAVALVWVPSLSGRIGTLSAAAAGGDASASGRFSELVAAWRAYSAHPFLGVGPGQFPASYQYYVGVVGGGVHTGEGERNAHNIIAGLAADLGTVGLVAFASLVAVILLRLFRTRRNPGFSGLATAAITSVSLYLGCSLFLHLAYARYLWLYLALGAAILVITGNPAGLGNRDGQGNRGAVAGGWGQHD